MGSMKVKIQKFLISTPHYMKVNSELHPQAAFILRQRAPNTHSIWLRGCLKTTLIMEVKRKVFLPCLELHFHSWSLCRLTYQRPWHQQWALFNGPT